MMTNNLFGSGRQKIQLIGINAPNQPRVQFGLDHTSDMSQRSATFANNSNQQVLHSRSSAPQGIKEPAPVRNQTIWSHQLSPHLQQKLRSGFSHHENSGRHEHTSLPTLDHIHVGPVLKSTPPVHVSVNPRQDGRYELRAKAGMFS